MIPAVDLHHAQCLLRVPERIHNSSVAVWKKKRKEREREKLSKIAYITNGHLALAEVREKSARLKNENESFNSFCAVV